MEYALRIRIMYQAPNHRPVFFPSRATRWRQGLLCARPRHAEHQPASDRGETAPPSAPARARSVNTYARPSAHGNIRASRAHSLTYSADHMPTPWAADDRVGRAERPPHTTRQALNHPQRAAAHRAALPAKPAPHSTVNRRTAQHITQPTPARAQQRRHTRAYPTRTRAQHARIARHRSAAHRAHLPTSAAASLPQSTSHTRARTLLTAGARIGRRREEPEEPQSRLEALRDPD